MKLANEIFENLEAYTEDEIRQALNQRIFDVGLDGVTAEDVSTDLDGETVVTFVDEEGDEMDVLFTIDPDDGAEAIILDDDEYEDGEDDEIEIDMVDLDALQPTLIDLGNGNQAIDLVNNRWMNKGFFETMFAAGDLFDADDTAIEERSAFVVRGGKKVKVALVRRKRRKRLTSKQRAGIRKGVRSRKKKAAQTARKRKKSLRIRKRLQLKKNTNSRLRVKGT